MYTYVVLVRCTHMYIVPTLYVLCTSYYVHRTCTMYNTCVQAHSVTYRCAGSSYCKRCKQRGCVSCVRSSSACPLACVYMCIIYLYIYVCVCACAYMCVCVRALDVVNGCSVSSLHPRTQIQVVELQRTCAACAARTTHAIPV